MRGSSFSVVLVCLLACIVLGNQKTRGRHDHDSCSILVMTLSHFCENRNPAAAFGATRVEPIHGHSCNPSAGDEIRIPVPVICPPPPIALPCWSPSPPYKPASQVGGRRGGGKRRQCALGIDCPTARVAYVRPRAALTGPLRALQPHVRRAALPLATACATAREQAARSRALVTAPDATQTTVNVTPASRRKPVAHTHRN